MKDYYQFKPSMIAGALALAVMTTVMPAPSVYAQSTTDLQAQIETLVAQIQQLQIQLQNQSAVTAPHTSLTRNLSIGMSGTDVRDLQRFLNQDPDTRLAISGAGSPGSETVYFGPITHNAVIKYQNKYRSDILTPLGLSQGTGFVGLSTRTHINTRDAITTPVTEIPNNPPVVEQPNEPDFVLQGEGEIGKMEVEEADDDTVREATSDAPIARVNLEARNGDLEISRIDVSLVANANNQERDPWDVLEDVSLWVDGEKIAEKRITDRDDFQSRTTGTLRFTGLDLVLLEDEEVEVTIAASLQNRVRGAGVAATWSVSMDTIRYKDGAGVVTTDTRTGDLRQAVTFEIVERGDGEELRFRVSNDSPVENTVIIKESKRTNGVNLLQYTIEALGSDIELDTLYVNVETGIAAYDDVVSDIELKIGNTTFKSDSIVSIGDYTSNSVLVAFDIDNKIEIDEDDSVTVNVLVDLKPKKDYLNGETIVAHVTSVERDRTEAEGADEVTEFSGTVIGNIQTLIAEGIFVPTDSVEFETKTIGSNSSVGVFTINFAVTAVENDFFIAGTATTSGLSTVGGVQYSVDSGVGTLESVNAVLTSSAREDVNGIFRVREGRTETFTLVVTVDPTTAGNHRVLLEAVYFSESGDGVTAGSTYTVAPRNDFRTPYRFINN